MEIHADIRFDIGGGEHASARQRRGVDRGHHPVLKHVRLYAIDRQAHGGDHRQRHQRRHDGDIAPPSQRAAAGRTGCRQTGFEGAQETSHLADLREL
jgi:hypothetical protein